MHRKPPKKLLTHIPPLQGFCAWKQFAGGGGGVGGGVAGGVGGDVGGGGVWTGGRDVVVVVAGGWGGVLTGVSGILQNCPLYPGRH